MPETSGSRSPRRVRFQSDGRLLNRSGKNRFPCFRGRCRCPRKQDLLCPPQAEQRIFLTRSPERSITNRTSQQFFLRFERVASFCTSMCLFVEFLPYAKLASQQPAVITGLGWAPCVPVELHSLQYRPSG